MQLILTGGGTGGHIYPALEVGRLAAEQGAQLAYFGSLRGQEGGLCAKLGIPFEGFPAEPLYSLRTPRGWKSAANLLRAQSMALRALKIARPDVVFSTGGYSAGPVVGAARKLGIPYILHDSNSVPGRSNRMFAKKAFAFATVFHLTAKFVDVPVTRTGQPIRKSLREAAKLRSPEEASVLVVGGSQGSAFLNELCPQAAALAPATRWMHSTGNAHLEKVREAVAPLGIQDRYQLRPYMEAEEMAAAYQRATVAVARSGGTLAEFALFGLPSVAIPLPSAADNHQMRNAEEFVEMGAALCLPQDEATPAALAEQVGQWLSDPAARAKAAEAMRAWDVPDATERLVSLIGLAAKGGRQN